MNLFKNMYFVTFNSLVLMLIQQKLSNVVFYKVRKMLITPPFDKHSSCAPINIYTLCLFVCGVFVSDKS